MYIAMGLNNRKLKMMAIMLMLILVIATNAAQSISYGNNSIPLSRRHRMIREAAKVSDKAMEAAYQTLKRVFKEEITEAQVITVMQQSIIENGSNPKDPEAPAFYFTVAAGNDSVIPHGNPENDPYHVIKPGDVVVIDMGARYKGYVSDMTRTFFIGEPTDYQKEIYNIVLETNKKTTDAVRSFILYRKLEKISREILSGYGYGDMPHSVSHGLGFIVHAKYPDQSWIGGGYLGSFMPLLPGMVITIEPGIYLEEEGFGIRIEDDVAVRLFGYELLTHYPKELEDAIIHCDVPERFDEVSIGIEPTDIIELESDGVTNCFVTVYNPSDMAIEVNVTIDNVPKKWDLDVPSTLLVEAGGKASENLRIQAPEGFDGTETIDISFSYYVSADPYVKGTPSTVSITIKSKEDVSTHFEYGPVVAFLIVLLFVAIAVILFLKRKN